MGGSLALAVDVGSSAVRAAAVDSDGLIMASARVERPDSLSGVLFDPGLLWEQLLATCRALAPQARARVGSLAIAGHVGTVFLDSNLRPVGSGRGWADTEGVQLVRERLGARENALLRSSGRPVATGGAAAAALWLRATYPDEFARVAHIASPKDVLVAMLTGTLVTDHTSAAYTGLSRVVARNWDPEILAAVDLDISLLPRQVASTDVVDVVADVPAAALGIPVGIPVICGGPDGTVGAAFVIGEASDLIADVAGTTDVVVGLIDNPARSPHAATLNPYPLGGFSIGGATGMTGGALGRWAALLGYADARAAVAALEGWKDFTPGSAGLRMLPTFSGGRFPRWRPHDSGALWGQRSEHRREHIIQAAAEGAAFTVREGIDLIDERSEHRSVIALAGGVARSRFLAQLRADVLNREIVLCEESEVSLMGAALLAFRGVGVMPDGHFDVSGLKLERVYPDAKRAAAYEQIYYQWQNGLDLQMTTA